MKRRIAIVALCLALCLPAGCGQKSEGVELTVFAASSMTETLTQLGEAYTAAHPQVRIVFNFDSSGTLKRQIEEGAQCDIFISAGQKQMDELEGVVPDSRFDILENKVALAVPEGNPAGIRSYDDLAAALRRGELLLAIGNADVPVGQYTQKILAYYGLQEAELASAITYGSNVKEVTTQVSEGMVDCGIIYQTDAFSAHLAVVDTASAEMCGQVIYPAAILQRCEHRAEAQAFLQYLTGEAGDKVFAAVGFTPIA